MDLQKKIFGENVSRRGDRVPVDVKKNFQSPPSINLMSRFAGRPPAPRREGGQAAEAGKSKIFVSVLEALINVSLVALFFGVPLFFTGLTFQGVDFDKQIYFYFWMLLALVSWVTKGVITGEMKIRRTPLDIPIALFWVLYLLSAIFSIDRWHSLLGFFGDPSRGLVSITALILAYYLILSHLNRKIFKWILGALAVSNFILAVWSILALLGVNFLPQKIAPLAPISLLGSISGLAAYLSLMIPILVCLVFKVRELEKRIAKNIVSVILLLLILADFFLLFSLYSFVPWVGILVGVSFLVIYVLSRIVRPAENWSWLAIGAFMLVLIILMIGSVKIVKINLPEVSPSIPAFDVSWKIAKDSLREKLLLGAGPGNYGYSFSLHKPLEFNNNAFFNLRFYQGTGIITEAASTLGGLGTIGLILVILTFLGSGIYLLTREKEKNKIYSLGFISATLIFITNAVMVRTEGSVLMMGILIGTLAITAVFWESGAEEKSLSLSLKASPKFALTLAFIFMVVSAGVVYLFVFMGKVFLADIYAGRDARATQVSEDGSIRNLIRAVGLYPREGRYYSRLAQEYLFLANQEALSGGKNPDITKIQNYLNGAMASAKAGRDLMPKDVSAVASLAQVYENAGLFVPDSLNLAQENYQKALDLEPHNPNLYLKLGQIKATQAVAAKDDAEKKNLIGGAKDLFQKSINEKSNFAAGYYNLSLAQEALGEIDSAIDSGGQAFTLENSNINYAFNLGRLYQARGKDEDNKIAESLFNQILGVNGEDINTLFSLGLLYEKTDRKKEALAEYQKVLDLLPADLDQARQKIEKMISNINKGIENTPENLQIPTVSATGASTGGSGDQNQGNASVPSSPSQGSIPTSPASPSQPSPKTQP